MNISDKIKYIGVDDTTIDLFESQYAVPDGVSYNSYVILDDKTALSILYDSILPLKHPQRHLKPFHSRKH